VDDVELMIGTKCCGCSCLSLHFLVLLSSCGGITLLAIVLADTLLRLDSSCAFSWPKTVHHSVAILSLSLGISNVLNQSILYMYIRYILFD
jgi:hypothetical protein